MLATDTETCKLVVSLLRCARVRSCLFGERELAGQHGDGEGPVAADVQRELQRELGPVDSLPTND